MSALSAILSAIVLAQGVFITWLARRVLTINASAKEGWEAAAYWRQRAGDLGDPLVPGRRGIGL